MALNYKFNWNDNTFFSLTLKKKSTAFVSRYFYKLIINTLNIFRYNRNFFYSLINRNYIKRTL
jgi:hypothetical protein